MSKTQSNLQANSTNFVHSERDFLDRFDTQPLTQKIQWQRSIKCLISLQVSQFNKTTNFLTFNHLKILLQIEEILAPKSRNPEVTHHQKRRKKPRQEQTSS